MKKSEKFYYRKKICRYSAIDVGGKTICVFMFVIQVWWNWQPVREGGPHTKENFFHERVGHSTSVCSSQRRFVGNKEVMITDKNWMTWQFHSSISTLGKEWIVACIKSIFHLKIACRAFLRDVDLNMSDYDGRTPLHLCSAEGHIDCVKFLLEVCKVYPDPKDRSNTNFNFGIFFLFIIPST